jgi:hypothetical protein
MQAIVDASVIVGLVSATVSVQGAVAAGIMTTWSTRAGRRYEHELEGLKRARDKAEQAEEILSRYREPLLLAAQNFHSRLFRIVDNNALASLHCGDADNERYVRNHTVYVIAEYLCWTWIIHHDQSFLDLGVEEHNRKLVQHLEEVHSAIADQAMPRPLRLYRGEQRAIGEIMRTATGTTEPRSESLGYAEFCTRLDDDPEFIQWLGRLRSGLDEIANTSKPERAQLIRLQHALVDLIDFLDPKQLRLPTRRRDKIPLSDTSSSDKGRVPVPPLILALPGPRSIPSVGEWHPRDDRHQTPERRNRHQPSDMGRRILRHARSAALRASAAASTAHDE